MGKIKKVWPPDSPYYRWYVRLDKYFSRKHRYSSDENFRQSVNQQRKTANMMARIFQVVLPLCLILLFSCKSKEKHYEIDLIIKSGDHQEGQFYHQGVKLSNDGYTARYQFIRENKGKLDTIIFYFVERDGKANPEEITIVGAQPDTAKQLSLPPNTFKFELADTSGYIAFDSSQWVGKIESNDKLGSPYFDSLIKEIKSGTIYMGHPHKRKYIRNEPNFHNTTLNNEQHFTIGYSTKCYAPLILSDSYGVMIRDSSGTVLAQRDTIGTWHVYDCSKALEETYKILFNKYKQ